jgi:carbamoyl-phosphate synthase large subunit
MKPLKILVTGVGGDLGQSAVKCLRHSGYELMIVGCDMNPYAGGRIDVDRFYQAPPVREAQRYDQFIIDIITKENIDYVYPFSDLEIIYHSQNLHRFDGTGATFIVQDWSIVETFSDKYKTVEYFKAKGIPYPRTWLAEDYREQLAYPVILKKRRGAGSQKLFKACDTEELKFYLKRNDGMIVQEYLPGDSEEYTAGLYRDRQTVHTITFRRTLAPGGFSQQVEPVPESETDIHRFARGVAETIEFTGSINVQFRRTADGCVPFEINPRFSSTVFFRHLYGFRDLQWSLDVREGKPVTYTPLYRKAIGVRTFGEVLLDVDIDQ